MLVKLSVFSRGKGCGYGSAISRVRYVTDATYCEGDYVSVAMRVGVSCLRCHAEVLNVHDLVHI